MITSKAGISLIKSFEGLRLNAYQDSVGIWTIGYGSVVYRSGVRVREGDFVSSNTAVDLLTWQVSLKEDAVNKAIFSYPVVLTQNQFDAIMSLVYNIGIGAFERSTLLKKVRRKPSDPAIREEFLKWCKGRVNGKLVVIPGLYKRRQKEWKFYSKM